MLSRDTILTVVSRVVSALRKSASCASKFVGMFDRVGKELEAKLWKTRPRLLEAPVCVVFI